MQLIRGSNYPSQPAFASIDSSQESSQSYKAKEANKMSGTGLSTAQDVIFIFSVCSAQFFSLAALAQSVAPLPIIGETFSTRDPGILSWYTAAYSLTVGTFILPAGRLGDMYGHKKMFVIGWTWFALWSLISGFSVYSGSILFSITRAFQGVGPAMLVPNAMALVGKTYPAGLKKNLIFSAFGAGGPSGYAVGAVFAALFGQLVWWPWAFWCCAMLCALMAALSILVVPKDEKSQVLPGNDEKPKFDYLGAITGVSGLVLINFAWNQGPVVGWESPYTYVLLIVGILFMIVFFYVELNLTRYPLIPLRGLKREAGYTLACIAAGWGSHGIWVYYLFWFLTKLRKHTVLLAAAEAFPVAIVGPMFAMSVGFLMRRFRPAHIMLLAMSLFLIGSILIATAPVDQSYWIQTFFSILIMPGGMNLSFPAGTILLSGALPKQNQGIAASLVSTTVNYSISLGLGIAGTINRYVTVHDGEVDFLRGYRGAWWFGAGLDGLGLVIALWFVWHTRPENTKLWCAREAFRDWRANRQAKKLGVEEIDVDSEKESSAEVTGPQRWLNKVKSGST